MTLTSAKALPHPLLPTRHVKPETYPQLLLGLVILHKWKRHLLLSKRSVSRERASLLAHVICNSDSAQEPG